MNSFVSSIHRWADAWSTYLWPAAWQAAVVGLCILAVVVAARRWSSPLRYGLLLVALAKFATPPFSFLPTGLLDPVDRRVGWSESAVVRAAMEVSDAPIGTSTPGTEYLTTAYDVRADEPALPSPTPTAPGDLAGVPTPRIAPAAATGIQDSERNAGPPKIAARAADVGPAKIGAGQGTASDLWLRDVGIAACLFVIWAGGAVLAAVWLLIQGIRVCRLVRSSRPVHEATLLHRYREIAGRLGIRRVPRLCESNEASVPLSCGVVRTAVVLPRDLTKSLTSEQIDQVFAHELAHHRRRDLWVSGLQGLLFVAWWFHPVYWLISRAMRRVREECCDDLVLASGCASRETYCDTLMAVARLQSSGYAPHFAMAMSASGRRLASRLARVTDQTLVRRRAISVFGLIVVAAAAAMLLPGVRGFEQEAVPPKNDQRTPGEVAANDEEPKIRSFVGTVVDEDGNPIAGADVLISRSNPLDARPEEHVILVGQGTTDEQGRFDVAVDSKYLTTWFNQDVEVWIYRPEFAFHVASFSKSRLYRPMNVTLLREAATFTVLQHDGQPASGAVVFPRYFSRDHLWAELPAVLQRKLRRETDEAGRVTLAAASRDDVADMVIESPGLAPQYVNFFGVEAGTPHAETISLADVGDLVVHLEAEDPRAVANVDVLVSTGPVDGNAERPYRNGTVLMTRTDEQGRAEVLAIAAGKLRLVVYENEEYALRAAPPEGQLVGAARTTNVKVPLKEAVRIMGRVLERGTDEPIPGVLVATHQGGRNLQYETNTRGEYSLLQFPGSVQIQFFAGPEHAPLPEFRPVDIPRGETHALPDIHLAGAYTLSGKTLTNNDEPVEKVFVRVHWTSEFNEMTPWRAYAPAAQTWGYSDENGNFTVDRVPLETSVQVVAQTDGVDVAGPISILGQPEEPLVIRVRESDLVTLTGTVVDGQGRSVPNIGFRIVQRSVASPTGGWIGPTDNGTTDAAGKIRSTKKLPRAGNYQIELIVDDAVVGESNWLNPAQANSTAFEPIVYGGLRVAREEDQDPGPNPPFRRVVLAGVAVDRAGQPIADADILVWSLAEQLRTTSGDDGSFAFPSIPVEGAFLFVQADGFRFHGQWAVPAADPIRVEQTRSSEPAEPMRALVEPPLGAALHEKAWQRFEPIGVEVLLRIQREGRPTSFNVAEYREDDVLRLLARYEPDWALEYVAEHKADDLFTTNSIKRQVAGLLAESDFERASKVAEESEPAKDRAYAFVQLAERLPHTAGAKKRSLLERAEEVADAADAGVLRAQSLIFVAAAYRQLGDAAKARELLAEAEAEFPDAPVGGYDQYILSLLVYERGVLDGVDLTDGLGAFARDHDRNRYLGNVAHALAATKPAIAEQLLKRTPGRQDRKVRVCHAMAAADLPRARRIAETIVDPVERAYAIGLIAAGITEKDREQAAALIAEAYELLVETVEAGTRTSTSIYGPVDTAVAMLPFVEAIDSTLVREYFWRSLSLRTNFTFGSTSMALGPHGDGRRMRLTDPVLAACLARYDLDVARHVLRPPGDKSLDEGVTSYPYFYFFTAAILDPEGTLDFVAKMPSDSRGQMIAQHQAWRELFASFAHRGLDRWDYLVDRQMHRWVPGKEDL